MQLKKSKSDKSSINPIGSVNFIKLRVTRLGYFSGWYFIIS